MYRLQFAASVPAPGLLLLRCHTEPALLLQGGNQRCACCCLLHGSGILGVLKARALVYNQPWILRIPNIFRFLPCLFRKSLPCPVWDYFGNCFNGLGKGDLFAVTCN